MKIAKWALAALTLAACVRYQPYLAPEFAGYVTEQELAEGTTSIVYGELYSRTYKTAVAAVAECQRYILETQIVVDRDAWLELSEAQRAWVVRHELGHCVGGLDHDERLRADGCPASLMFPYVPSDKCLSP